jgi:hypothetical protein
VLDQNFPLAVKRKGAAEAAVSSVGLEWPFDITLVPLAEIDPGLVEQVEDWQILEALHRRGGIDGLITNDERILSQAREMVVLSRTRLVLVVTRGTGHDPLRATAEARGLFRRFVPCWVTTEVTLERLQAERLSLSLAD